MSVASVAPRPHKLRGTVLSTVAFALSSSFARTCSAGRLALLAATFFDQ
jgi:hypothetical protein